MANPKLKKFIRKYKRYAPLLILVCVPFLIGILISFKVKEEITTLNRKLRLANIPVTLMVESFIPKYLNSSYKLMIKHSDKNEVLISVPVSLDVSNMPGMAYFLKGQMRFDFTIQIEKMDVHTDLRAVEYQAIVENIDLNGGFILPSGFALKGTIAKVTNSQGKFSAENIVFDLNSNQGEWLSSINGSGIKLRAFDVAMILNDFKFTMNGDTQRQTNDYGYTIGMTIKVPSHSSTDLKFNTGGTIHNIPHDLDVIERDGMKAYADSGASFDVSASLSIGKPAFKSIAKGNAVKTGVEVEGIFDINIPEAYRQDKIIVPIVGYLNSNAEEFKKNYDVDLNQLKVNIPFNVKDRQFLLNGKRFYSCNPEIKGATQNFKLEDLKAVSLEDAKLFAMEDLLSEDNSNKLAESYCRLHYAYEFSRKTDASLPAMMNLLKVRSSYIFQRGGEDSKHEAIALRKLKKDLIEDEELLILSQAYHCYLDPNGKPCLDKFELISHENLSHPFKKLLDLNISGTTEPMTIPGLVPKEGTRAYLVHAYDLLKTKALNSYYLKQNMAKELAENINKHATVFRRNFMHYQVIDYTCRFLKETDCINSIEKAHPSFTSPKLTNIYLDLKIKLLKDLNAEGKGPNCSGFVSEMAAKIPLSLENPRFQLLMKECPGGYILPETKNP